ncbi:MAG: hypothetical protein ACRDH9_03810 [Actinomycetota bacterium]
MRKILTAFAALGLVAALGFAGPTFGATKNHGASDTGCTDNGNIETSPTVLWPPNHKDVTITFNYTDDDGAANLEIFMNPHNEIIGGEEINGTGNTPAATDSTPGAAMDGGTTDTNSTDGEVGVQTTARAERSGHKNDDGGRVYEFDYRCEDDSGDSEESSMTTEGDGILVFVPHDCRGGSKTGACHN